jgi:hypothetical protein
MAQQQASTSHRARALSHLQKIKPGDGWSLQESPTDGTVRLCRRGVPLTDNAFVDLYHDGDGSVRDSMASARPKAIEED